jgi:predicted small secreted protein
MKTLVTLIATLFLLAGCNTIEGLGKDIKTAGGSLENAAKKNK